MYTVFTTAILEGGGGGTAGSLNMSGVVQEE